MVTEEVVSVRQRKVERQFVEVLPFVAGLAAAGLYVIAVKQHVGFGLILLSPLLILALLWLFKRWRKGG